MTIQRDPNTRRGPRTKQLLPCKSAGPKDLAGVFGRIGNSWRAVPGWSAVSEDPRSSACAPWPTAVRELHDRSCSFPWELHDLQDRTAIAERKRGDDTHPQGRDNLLARFMSGAAIAQKINEVDLLFSTSSVLLAVPAHLAAPVVGHNTRTVDRAPCLLLRRGLLHPFAPSRIVRGTPIPPI